LRHTDNRLAEYEGQKILIGYNDPRQQTSKEVNMYRIGLPGWKIAARLGIPLSMRVHIHRDPECSGYWTSSPDLRGLIVTGESIDDLFQEVKLAAPDLIELELGKPANIARTTFTPVDNMLAA
jgi:predicted RNase H-like HicB family nuclease